MELFKTCQEGFVKYLELHDIKPIKIEALDCRKVWCFENSGDIDILFKKYCQL